MNKNDVIEKIFKKVIDAEIGIDIWTLGLIYDFKLEKNSIFIKMTFTSPFCPYAEMILEEIGKLCRENGLKYEIEVVYDPPWQPSQELKKKLGF